MRILRLSNSNDAYFMIPEELRAPAVATRKITELTGEPVESETRFIWPSRSLPERVDRWVEETRPDVVLVRTSSFWVNFESVPLKFQRQFGRVGKRLARVGLKAGENDRLAHNRAFRSARAWTVRRIGGATYFTPAEATTLTMAAVRRAAQNEALLVVVRGPHHSHNAGHTRAGQVQSEQRRREFEQLLRDECERSHVPFVPVIDPDEASRLLSDDVHDNVEGHRFNGEIDGEAIAAAWMAALAR